MYYSSATSQDVIFLRSSINVEFIDRIARRIRGFNHQKQVFVLSAFFICTFMIAAFQNSTSYASTREIAEDYHRQGYDAQINDNYSKALAYYYKAAAVDSQNSSYWNDIGLAYESIGDPASAEKAYLRAIKINSSYLAPYANLGHFYKRKQDLVKAIYFFKKRIELGDPADPWTKKAREDLGDVYSSTPLLRERFMNAETNRLNLQASQQTRENFKNQMRVASSEYERGLLLLREQKTVEALKAFNASLAFAPENPKAVQARREAMRLHRVQQVAQHTEKAIELIKQGNEQAAKQQFREILAIIPNQTN
jgi:tetratricopeptide (TPR) repeat protein